MRRALLALALALLGGILWLSYRTAYVYAKGTSSEGPWIVSRFEGHRLAERLTFVDLAGAQAHTAAHSSLWHVAKVTGEGPLPMNLPAVAGMFCSAGHDGIRAEYAGTVAYLTPLELKRDHAYEAVNNAGFDFEKIWAMLAARFALPVPTFRNETRLTRVRMDEEIWGLPPEASARRVLNEANVRAAVRDGAHYLLRNLNEDGRFNYQVDTATGAIHEGYNLPRHAGTTTFLAQAAHALNEPELREGALRAAQWLIRERTLSCGTYRCIGENQGNPNLGSAALAALAYAAVLEGGDDVVIRRELVHQLNFVRSLQREDGEFQHQYDRAANAPIDIQLPYYSGEATLALSRGARFTGREEDLEAAKRAFTYATQKAWSFFGSRYLPQEEHWTCQALADLWDRAPDENGLRYCLQWHTIQRGLQLQPGEGPEDFVGAFGVTPLIAPRVTPAGSRSESSGATLSALLRAHPDSPDIPWLRHQFEAAIQFTMRTQVLRADTLAIDKPDLVHGGFPASTVDGDIRIDTVQHVGAAMLRWLELHATNEAEE